MGAHVIARELEQMGALTNRGNKSWYDSTVLGIIKKPDIFDLRQRHSRQDARKSLESANLLAPGAFVFWPCSSGCAGTGCSAVAVFLLP